MDDTSLPAKGDDKALLKKLKDIREDLISYRSQFEADWKEAEAFYHGDQWRFAKKRPVKNWVFTIIEGETPVLTDIGNQLTDIVPLEEQHTEVAKVLEAGVQNVFERERMIIKLTQGVRSSLITGTGWLYVDYDPDIEGGDGNIVIKNLGWRHVWIDPAASEIDEANQVLIEIPTNIEDLKRRFPGKADEIKVIKDGDEVSGEIKPDGTASDRWSPHLTRENPKSRFDSGDITTVEEYWLVDYSLTDIPEEDTIAEIEKESEELLSGINPDVGKFEDHEMHIEAHLAVKKLAASQALQLDPQDITDADMEALAEDQEIGVAFKIIDDHIRSHRILAESNPDGKKPKYPNNMRLVIKNGGTILYDGRAPENDGKVPLVPIYAYKLEDSIYGVGEVKNIISPQKSFNEMDYAELQGLRLTGNSGWIVDEESGVDVDTLSNAPGLVVKKKQGTEARRLEPGTVSPQMGSRKFGDRDSIEAISGINEASQGRKPSGVTAAAAINSLQGSTRSRINLKQRYLLEYALPRLTELVSSRIVKRWSVEKKLRAHDADGQIQFIEFKPEEIQKLRYDVRPLPSTNAGLAKEDVFATMSQLVQVGAIDAKTFVELTDLPFRSKILQRMQENDQVAAQMEQLAAENEQLKAQLEGGLVPEDPNAPPTDEELETLGIV